MFCAITETGRSSGTLMKNTRVAGLAEICSKQKIALPISNSNQQPTFMQALQRLRSRGQDARHNTISE